MVMNKVSEKSNMYEFCTHTINFIKGSCSHNCSYCYVRRWGELKPVRLDEKELKTDLGENNYVFVGSGTDMFADDIPTSWINKVIKKVLENPKNTYFFQTKNPKRFLEYEKVFPTNTVLCMTLETNRDYPGVSDAPKMFERVRDFAKIKGYKKSITIEPIIDFDVPIFVEWIRQCEPDSVNIGADSQNKGLIEPESMKIKLLINQLKRFTKVHLKKNLSRLYKESP